MYKICENIGYGDIISEKIDNTIKYNIRYSNGKLLTDKWFDTYTKDEQTNRCIIGYRRTDSIYPYIYGGLNEEGINNVKIDYDFLLFCDNNIYLAMKHEKFGLISSEDGKIIIPIILDDVSVKNGDVRIVYKGIEKIMTKYDYSLATANGIVYKTINLDDFLNDNNYEDVKNKELVFKKENL